ncbi:hypothetical protein HDU79_010430 [Rhizoclosmatium sp. JEL0117]|nr:hypothetical protein HDU79_010430 [Rhizoclosmatium sp. JEL0117]
MGGLESNVTTDWHQIAYQSLRIDWADVANSAHPRPVFAAIICVVLVCVCIYFAVAPSPVRLTHAANTVLVRRHSRTSSKVATNVPLSSLVRSACPSLAHGRFFPTPWLVSGHLQTLYAGLVSKFPELRANYDRELFDLPDGGLIAIDWNKNHKDMPATSPILILLHGLAGGSRETYICDLVPYALRDNYRVAALNFRGCGNTEITTPQLYSAAHTADLRALINHIHQSYPLAPLVGIGFSLGANILLKYVGEESTKCPLIACVSVANPYDLNLGINGLHSSFIGKQLYSKVMTQSLIGIYKRHRNMFEKNPQHPQFSDPLSPNQILNAKYLPDFDEAATRRVFGYRTVSEYYRMGSSAQYIPDLAIPTLMLSDLDDPIALSSSIPLADALGNPYVILATTRNGGHLGWFEGIFFPKRWFPTPVMEFVNALVEVNFHAVVAYTNQV